MLYSGCIWEVESVGLLTGWIWARADEEGSGMNSNSLARAAKSMKLPSAEMANTVGETDLKREKVRNLAMLSFFFTGVNIYLGK